MPAGAPPIFDSPDYLQDRIDQYFIDGMTKKPIVIGHGKDKSTISMAVPTISGLSNYLGFESRQSFYDYEKRPEFSYTIKKARHRIEQHYEELLQTGNTTGAIFALKNLGWSDRQEIDQKTTIQDERIDESRLTDEQLRALAEIQRSGRTGQA